MVRFIASAEKPFYANRGEQNVGHSAMNNNKQEYFDY